MRLPSPPAGCIVVLESITPFARALMGCAGTRYRCGERTGYGLYVYGPRRTADPRDSTPAGVDGRQVWIEVRSGLTRKITRP
jgi:hypothetical protein